MDGKTMEGGIRMTAKIKMKDSAGKSKIMTQQEIENVRRKLANEIPGVTIRVQDNTSRNGKNNVKRD